MKNNNFTNCVGKTKMLISYMFAATAQLICVFVFAYANIRFSHDEAHMSCVIFAYAKTKKHISCVVTAQEISAFVFTTQTVQSLFFKPFAFLSLVGYQTGGKAPISLECDNWRLVRK